LLLREDSLRSDEVFADQIVTKQRVRHRPSLEVNVVVLLAHVGK
jgi:hypothetical protein